MSEQSELEEEAGKGIPKGKLMHAGARYMGLADYLFLENKIYEPTRWERKMVGSGSKRGIKMIPTHYRERHMSVPQADKV